MGTRAACTEFRHSFIRTDCHHAGEPFVADDLATTGLDPDQDEFIQIVAMHFSAGCLYSSDTLASYVRPRWRISAFIES
jgi:DNA polymerase III alpha subunit (gram-positive type)